MADSEKLIVALDMSDPKTALDLVDRLSEQVKFFKIGLQLFTAAGPPVVREVLKRRGKVFLDLKLHDIPNTVAQTAVQAGRMGVHMITIHTLGGPEMMSRARRSVQDAAQREGWERPKLLGVTVLTSMDQQALEDVGIRMSLEGAASMLAALARDAGLDGVVASPRELKLLRKSGLGDLLFVTPGIRPLGADSHDQARTTTPSEAIEEGADYLVVGRPITSAPHPLEAARLILDEMAQARRRI